MANKRIIIGLLSALVVSGCTASTDWQVADQRLDQRSKDFARCRFEAQKAVGSVGGNPNLDSVGTAIVSGLSEAAEIAIRVDWLTRECMKVSGYSDN